MPIYNMYQPPRNNECYIIKAEKKTGLKYVGIIDKGYNDYFYTLDSYRKPNDPTKRVFSKCGFKTLAEGIKFAKTHILNKIGEN